MTKNSKYIFKYTEDDGTTVDYEFPTGVTFSEFTEHFRYFSLACGFQPETVNKLIEE